MDIYVGLIKSVNDSQILQKLSLYKQAQYWGLFSMEKESQYGFNIYLCGDIVATINNNTSQRKATPFYS
jgi:hypothetical protein